jgi:hypothetical protein
MELEFVLTCSSLSNHLGCLVLEISCKPLFFSPWSVELEFKVNYSSFSNLFGCLIWSLRLLALFFFSPHSLES